MESITRTEAIQWASEQKDLTTESFKGNTLWKDSKGTIYFPDDLIRTFHDQIQEWKEGIAMFIAVRRMYHESD